MDLTTLTWPTQEESQRLSAVPTEENVPSGFAGSLPPAFYLPIPIQSSAVKREIKETERIESLSSPAEEKKQREVETPQQVQDRLEREAKERDKLNKQGPVSRKRKAKSHLF